MATLQISWWNHPRPLWIHSWHPSESKFESPGWDPNSERQILGGMKHQIYMVLWWFYEKMCDLYVIYMRFICDWYDIYIDLQWFYDGFMMFKSNVLMYLIYGNTPSLNT